MKKLLMGSLVLTIFAFAITIFQLSCVKATVAQTKTITDTIYLTKTDTAFVCTPSINGLWIGTYTVDGNAGYGQQYFSLIIKPDGTMINDTKWGGQQNIGIGTWTLVGDSLTCTMTGLYGQSSNIGVQEKQTAIFNKTTGQLSGGVWVNLPPNTGSGTFVLTKVN